MARRLPYKSNGILATIQSDINISPFAKGTAVRPESNESIGASPGPPRGLPILNGSLKFLTASLTKRVGDSAHPAYSRIASIDIARGATVGLMIFVNHAGNQPAWIRHAAWDGLHLADVVMPSFLLLVGVSAVLSLSSARQKGVTRGALMKKALNRAGRMALLGLVIQGGAATRSFPAWDLSRLRYFGVLQRIAICFLLASAVVLYLPESRPPRPQEWAKEEESSAWALIAPYRFHAFWWSLTLAVFAGKLWARFTGMSLLLTPPGCSEWPALTPACNVAAWADQRLYGAQHMYPFPPCRRAQPPCPYLDPEGLFTTLGGASVSTFIGLWFGAALLTLRSHRGRLQAWATASALLCELGAALHLTGVVPINKSLYSASYVLMTAGISGGCLCAAYLLTDVLHAPMLARLSQPLRWLGLNAVLVYAGDQILERALLWVYWGSPDAHLLASIQGRFEAALGSPGWVPDLALALANVAFWTCVAGLMHRKRWYLRV